MYTKDRTNGSSEILYMLGSLRNVINSMALESTCWNVIACVSNESRKIMSLESDSQQVNVLKGPENFY